MESTISDLCRMTGHVYRTVRARLDAAGIVPARTEGRSIYYDSVVALPAIYGRADDDELDLSRERALLAAEQRRKLERENAIAEELVAPVSQITEAIARVSTRIGAMLDALPLEMKRRNPLLSGHDITTVKRTIADCRNSLVDEVIADEERDTGN